MQRWIDLVVARPPEVAVAPELRMSADDEFDGNDAWKRFVRRAAEVAILVLLTATGGSVAWRVANGQVDRWTVWTGAGVVLGLFRLAGDRRFLELVRSVVESSSRGRPPEA